jgi:hypothetical protein
MGQFQDCVKAHMEKYNGQNKELEGRKGGLWKGKGKPQPHILVDNKNDWKLNLMLPYREQGTLVQDIESGVIKKHMYAHHLNSSQIMCMNFFYPLMQENKLDVILKFINPKINWGKPIALFEYNSPMEVGRAAEMNCVKKFGEPTNFDFFITTSNGYRLYFEIKYTEAEFGTPEKVKDATDIKRFPSQYFDKFDVYKTLMPRCIEAKKKDDAIFFLEHYQLMRNLIHLQSSNDYVIFLVPEDNPIIDDAKEIRKILTAHEDNCKVVGWKEIWQFVYRKVKNDTKLANYYAEFEEKYLRYKK